MASKELLDLLNQGIAREIQVSVQYIWQHVQWSGVAHYSVKDELKKIAIAEMKHAEAIAERLFYLGGIPTTKPDPIFVGETLKEMLSKDLKDEESAVQLYKLTIGKAEAEGDITTAQIFKKI
ncbi:MAG: ferritin Dps family protein, partial [Acidobacteria bacterium]|nr:ferritin Dps family protein [Acidobacteriota bacterium]